MSKEILFKVLRHEEAERVPWVPVPGVHAGALKGYSAFEVSTDADKLYESLLEVHKLYTPDGMPVVFDLQLEKEERLAGMSKDAVILLDRGLMDNAGYLPDDELDMLLAERGMTRADAYARYDAVVHLVTAAIGAEEFFSHETNEHRLEGVVEAARVDHALQRGWSGHPSLRVIENGGAFEEKLNRAIAAVFEVLEMK